MKKLIHVLIAGEKTVFSEKLVKELEKNQVVNIIENTEWEKEATDIVRKNRVDVLITSMELKDETGIHLIDMVNSNRKMVIIALVEYASSLTQKVLRQQHVDFIYHITDAESDAVKIAYLVDKFAKAIFDEEAFRVTNNQENICIEKVVKQILRELGFKSIYRGTVFIEEAVLLLLEQDWEVFSITKDIYHILAQKHNTTPMRVESNIRFVIERVWLESDMMRIKKLYPFEVDANRGKPSNKSFILNLVSICKGKIE